MLHTYIISSDTSVTITENKKYWTNYRKRECWSNYRKRESWKAFNASEHYLSTGCILWREGNENKLPNYSYPKRNFENDERSFCLRGMESGTGYTRRWSLYCIICANVYHHNVINDIIVGNSFVTTGNSNWKNARSNDKGFHQQEISKCRQQAI